MGYGIILWLDDRAVRSLAVERGADDAAHEVGRLLAEVVGNNPHPGALPPFRLGPWQRLGSCHSSHFARIEVGPTGGRLLSGEALPPAPGGLWQPQLGAGAMHRAEVELLRNPHRLAIAMAQSGGNAAEAVFGPNRVVGRSLASLWWLQADALSVTAPDATTGRAVLGLIETQLGDGISVGNGVNALGKAGSLLSPEPVGVIWHGNRICTLDELTEREREALTSRTA